VRGESRSTALDGIRVGYLHGSALTAAGLIFGRGRRRKTKKKKKKKKTTREGSRHLSLSGVLTAVRA